MMSPRSFLVSRQNQNLRASPPTSSTTTSNFQFVPPSYSAATPTASLRGKDAQNSPLFSRINYTNENTDAAKMAVNARSGTANSARTSPLPSPPRSDSTDTRPTTPTSPVQIPNKYRKDSAHAGLRRNHHHHDQRRHRSSSPRWRDVHSPDAVPPSVAALLAVTAIPPSRRSLRQRSWKENEKRMTVESILERTQESEKELSLNFIKGPLDVLLSPPDEVEDDGLSIGDSTVASPLSTRTVSCESVPSLTDSFSTETFSSVGSPQSAGRGRRMRPKRSSLTPVSSPPGELEAHPLSTCAQDVEDMDFRVFDPSPESEEKKSGMRLAFQPIKSAFKSNLTASLRALRNAARSFSTMNMPSIPPEDFLTRSILTMEPNVPFTDERMPPTLDEEPSAAVRRYLNPTQTARLESQASSSTPKAQGSYTASIQMQTYKVHRSRSSSSIVRSSRTFGDQPARGKDAAISFPNGPRQREMRENSDFIRVAVMEMAMRRSGKLDEQRPGRARWALPPRKTSAKPYEIGTDGVPARWIPVTH